jgi:hypothetical protein
VRSLQARVEIEVPGAEELDLAEMMRRRMS